MNAPAPALAVRDLTVHFPGQPQPAVEGVSFEVGAGSIVALVGPNGSGKTSLLRAVLNLGPWRGEVAIFGAPFARAHAEVGYVPQHFAFDITLPITVEEVVRLPLAVRRRAGARAAAREALARVRAGHLAARPLATLSGGERQRVLLARALAGRPRLLLLDEPEAGVDLGGEQTLYGLLEDLAGEARLAVLVASHELELVFRHTDHVVCLNRRLICSGPPAEVLTAETLQAMYGGLVTLYGHHGHARPGTRP